MRTQIRPWRWAGGPAAAAQARALSQVPTGPRAGRQAFNKRDQGSGVGWNLSTVMAGI